MYLFISKSGSSVEIFVGGRENVDAIMRRQRKKNGDTNMAATPAVVWASNSFRCITSTLWTGDGDQAGVFIKAGCDLDM